MQASFCLSESFFSEFYNLLKFQMIFVVSPQLNRALAEKNLRVSAHCASRGRPHASTEDGCVGSWRSDECPVQGAAGLPRRSFPHKRDSRNRVPARFRRGQERSFRASPFCDGVDPAALVPAGLALLTKRRRAQAARNHKQERPSGNPGGRFVCRHAFVRAPRQKCGVACRRRGRDERASGGLDAAPCGAGQCRAARRAFVWRSPPV